MNTIPESGASHLASPKRTGWRSFPVFWTGLFGFSLALNTASLITNHPERLNGWHGVGFAVLMVSLVAAYPRFVRGRIYRDNGISERQALFSLAIQCLIVLLLIVAYDTSFAWYSLALPFQIIGGLPKRYWPLTLSSVLLLTLVATVTTDVGGLIDLQPLIIRIMLFVTCTGFAAFIRLLNDQRDQLRAALDDLRQAHAALEANAAQAEEMAVLRERNRLARAMHDDLGHLLVLVNVKLEAAQLLYAHDPSKGDAELEATRGLVRKAMTELRQALANLRNPSADLGELPAILGKLAQDTETRSRIKVTCCVAPGLPALPSAIREALWYISREALANVEQHAGATSVTLSVDPLPDGCLLRVADDGSGIVPDDLQAPNHYGITGMRERVEAVGGTFSIRHGVRGGTVVEARFPTSVVEKATI